MKSKTLMLFSLYPLPMHRLIYTSPCIGIVGLLSLSLIESYVVIGPVNVASWRWRPRAEWRAPSCLTRVQRHLKQVISLLYNWAIFLWPATFTIFSPRLPPPPPPARNAIAFTCWRISIFKRTCLCQMTFLCATEFGLSADFGDIDVFCVIIIIIILQRTCKTQLLSSQCRSWTCIAVQIMATHLSSGASEGVIAVGVWQHIESGCSIKVAKNFDKYFATEIHD